MLTTDQVGTLSRLLASQMFPPTVTAIYSLDDLASAVQAFDAAFDMTIDQAKASGLGSATLIQAFNALLPATFANATIQVRTQLAQGVLFARAGMN